MARPPPDEPSTRKNIALPDALWAAISEQRKAVVGPIPPEAEMVRILLREALQARQASAPSPSAATPALGPLVQVRKRPARAGSVAGSKSA